MFDKETDATYKKVDSLFKLKLSQQILGSGLFFTAFWHVTELVRDKTFYYVTINDKYAIKFQEVKMLYIMLGPIIDKEISFLESEIKRLEYHLAHDLHPDDVHIKPQINGYSYNLYKLDKLKIRVSALLAVIKEKELKK